MHGYYGIINNYVATGNFGSEAAESKPFFKGHSLFAFSSRAGIKQKADYGYAHHSRTQKRQQKANQIYQQTILHYYLCLPNFRQIILPTA